MTSRWVKPLLSVAAASVVGVWLYDASCVIKWVGSVELLEVQFVVTDAATGAPVPGAGVEILTESGFHDGRPEREASLVADANGVARKELPGWMSAGSLSRLGFTDTFTLRPLWWSYRVTAEGYEPSQLMDTSDQPEAERRPQKTGLKRYKLMFPIGIRKKRG